jgi:tetratricopeptide (TPR) repeat protein
MFAFSPEIYNDRAYARYRLKDYKGALKDCNKAISLMPDFMSAYYNKGIIYLEMGKPEIAIKELDTTLAITNNFYFGYFYRGMAKKQLNDMKGALEDWQESVRLGFTPAQDTINKYSK